MRSMANGARPRDCASRSQDRTSPFLQAPAIKGDYARHHFAYVAPAGDPDAGASVLMQLLNEEEMNVYKARDGKTGEPALWRRCQVTS
jgi:hypothetical protein